jgi:hypothetical protein
MLRSDSWWKEAVGARESNEELMWSIVELKVERNGMGGVRRILNSEVKYAHSALGFSSSSTESEGQGE